MTTKPHLPASLAQLPFRGSAAVAAGTVSKDMLRGGKWRRLLPDVYAHRDVVVDHRLWCAAVSLILPRGSAIGGLSAAYLWGAELSRATSPVSVVTPRDRWTNRNSRIVAHHTVIADSDLTELDGVLVTTPERTAFDLGRRLRRTEALVSMDIMIRDVKPDLVVVQEMAVQRRGWPRVAQLKEVLKLADPRAESPMESRLRLLLHDAGVPPAVPQHEVRDDRGRLIGRVDLAWPAARLAVEYEGDHHRERDQYRRDVARTNALRSAGWTVLRFTADDLHERPRETAMTVAAELARYR
ncbi:DUF559 domain-containing protein [Actinoplanes sp. GCM10030250]|uniref:DUF559 domain-containing protein n=1 Tax=Actinoplanes sp. GCM10030250 TaxID=3273376 RepID=UPI003617C43B